MSQACRNELGKVVSNSACKDPAHSGLVLARCLTSDIRDPDAVSKLLDLAIGAQNGAMELYQKAYLRWRRDLEAFPYAMCQAEMGTCGRLIVGLGTPSALETGISLHHTYGVPYLPGTALKGLAAHYCDQVWGWGEDGDVRFRKHRERSPDDPARGKELAPGDAYAVLFGTTEDAGHITFHDAWYIPRSVKSLVRDVMTPHHMAYYGEKNGAAPTDFDEPNPVSFLSVNGSFLLAVSCDLEPKETAGRQWAELALTLLSQALEEWGIGGKTSSGYGRLRKTSGPAQVPAVQTGAQEFG